MTKCPLGYLITFTTYGTWLHGDKRGSIDKEHKRYGAAFVAADSTLYRRRRYALKNPPFALNKSRRHAVLNAILQVCKFRGWFAHAVHVRNNHVHIVVNGRQKPQKMMTDFKAYATRAIKNVSNGKSVFKKYWTRHGSTKYLWTKESLVSAIRYVKNEQGPMMAFGQTNTNGAPNVSEG